MSQRESAPAATIAGSWLVGRVLPSAVLVFGLLMSLSAWWLLRERELQIAEQDFEAEIQTGIQEMRERLMAYEVLLRSGAAMLGTADAPNEQLWRRYVQGLDLPWRFPALTGLGFAPAVDPSGLQALQIEQHQQGRLLFSIRPTGLRPLYAPILFLEPATPENQRVIGYDMFSELVRQEAMQSALETGYARVSGPVQLQQESGEQRVAGLLLYVPVYAGQNTPANVKERRDAMRGWVYAPFRAQAFLDVVLGRRDQDYVMRISDVTYPGHPQPLATGKGFAEVLAGKEALLFEQVLEVHGRQWHVEVVPRNGIADDVSGRASSVALLAGILMSGLLFFIAWLLARMREQARVLAVRMSEASSRNEQRFRSAMQYSPVGAALLDHDGMVVEANPTLTRILGQPAHTLVGTALCSHFVDNGEMLAADDAPEDAHRIIRRLRRADGVQRHARLAFADLPVVEGDQIARLVKVEDITDQLQAEARIHSLNRTLESRVEERTRELRVANEEMEAFAYSVSHDLRAPLRAINGFSHLVQQRHAAALEDDARGYLARIQAAALRMDELIDALLRLATIGRGELVREPLDLSAMAARVVEELRLTDPGRTVEVDIAEGLQAEGDRSLVGNVLENLIGNAWKFSGHCKVAKIHVGRDDDGMFFVRDNGAGFDPEYAGKMFKAFQRLHSQSQFSGHGIGLTTVKRIVERHGGTISAIGVPGEGATFRFSLGPRSASSS